MYNKFYDKHYNYLQKSFSYIISKIMSNAYNHKTLISIYI